MIYVVNTSVELDCAKPLIEQHNNNTRWSTHLCRKCAAFESIHSSCYAKRAKIVAIFTWSCTRDMRIWSSGFSNGKTNVMTIGRSVGPALEQTCVFTVTLHSPAQTRANSVTSGYKAKSDPKNLYELQLLQFRAHRHICLCDRGSWHSGHTGFYSRNIWYLWATYPFFIFLSGSSLRAFRSECRGHFGGIMPHGLLVCCLSACTLRAGPNRNSAYTTKRTHSKLCSHSFWRAFEGGPDHRTKENVIYKQNNMKTLYILCSGQIKSAVVGYHKLQTCNNNFHFSNVR